MAGDPPAGLRDKNFREEGGMVSYRGVERGGPFVLARQETTRKNGVAVAFSAKKEPVLGAVKAWVWSHVGKKVGGRVTEGVVT